MSLVIWTFAPIFGQQNLCPPPENVGHSSQKFLGDATTLSNQNFVKIG